MTVERCVIRFLAPSRVKIKSLVLASRSCCLTIVIRRIALPSYPSFLLEASDKGPPWVGSVPQLGKE